MQQSRCKESVFFAGYVSLHWRGRGRELHCLWNIRKITKKNGKWHSALPTTKYIWSGNQMSTGMLSPVFHVWTSGRPLNDQSKTHFFARDFGYRDPFSASAICNSLGTFETWHCHYCCIVMQQCGRFLANMQLFHDGLLRFYKTQIVFNLMTTVAARIRTRLPLGAL